MSEKYLKYVNDFITGDIDHLIEHTLPLFDNFNEYGVEKIVRFRVPPRIDEY